MSIMLSMEKEEELMNDLEVFIDCFKEITDEFKNLTNPSFTRREDFFNEYINLEDSILSTLAQIEYIENAKINSLIEQFNSYWNCYQDTWSEEYWEQYEYLRKCRDKLFGVNNEINISNQSIMDVSNLMKKDFNKQNSSNLWSESRLYRKEETFGKIDEELNNIELDKQQFSSNKRRGCIDCIIY